MFFSQNMFSPTIKRFCPCWKKSADAHVYLPFIWHCIGYIQYFKSNETIFFSISGHLQGDKSFINSICEFSPVTIVLASSFPPPSLKNEYITSVWSPRMATTFETDSTLIQIKLLFRFFLKAFQRSFFGDLGWARRCNKWFRVIAKSYVGPKINQLFKLGLFSGP